MRILDSDFETMVYNSAFVWVKTQDWKFGIWIPSIDPVPHHRRGMPIAIDCSTVFAEHLCI